MKTLLWLAALLLAIVGGWVSLEYKLPWLFVVSGFIAGFCLLTASNLLGRKQEAEPKKVGIKVIPPP